VIRMEHGRGALGMQVFLLSSHAGHLIPARASSIQSSLYTLAAPPKALLQAN
jgi:hypothetical protein